MHVLIAIMAVVKSIVIQPFVDAIKATQDTIVLHPLLIRVCDTIARVVLVLMRGAYRDVTVQLAVLEVAVKRIFVQGTHVQIMGNVYRKVIADVVFA